MGKILRWLTAVPQLLIAVTALKEDAQTMLHSPETIAAWERFRNDPAVMPALSRLLAEWQAVETAIERLR